MKCKNIPHAEIARLDAPGRPAEMQRAWRKAREVLMRDWPAVLVVAAILRERLSLSGADFEGRLAGRLSRRGLIIDRIAAAPKQARQCWKRACPGLSNHCPRAKPQPATDHFPRRMVGQSQSPTLITLVMLCPIRPSLFGQSTGCGFLKAVEFGCKPPLSWDFYQRHRIG
jgi:hypothetical protein